MAEVTINRAHREIKGPAAPCGYIDGVTSKGMIEGWAYDEQAPWSPLEVRIRCNGEWIASGLAHQHREDVVEAGIGTGWCGFRLWSGRSADVLRNAALYLVGMSGSVIAKSDDTALLPDLDKDLTSIEDVVAADPTIARSVEHLRGCEPLFTHYIRSYGIDAFVRVAYVFMLGRPVDEAGLRIYGNRLRRGTHHAFELLQILAASEEFLSKYRELIAPSQSSFPFLVG